MNFGQLAQRESLRDVVTCLNAHPEKLCHLGLTGEIKRLSLITKSVPLICTKSVPLYFVNFSISKPEATCTEWTFTSQLKFILSAFSPKANSFEILILMVTSNIL
jgi:hypothetical protein